MVWKIFVESCHNLKRYVFLHDFFEKSSPSGRHNGSFVFFFLQNGKRMLMTGTMMRTTTRSPPTASEAPGAPALLPRAPPPLAVAPWRSRLITDSVSGIRSFACICTMRIAGSVFLAAQTQLSRETLYRTLSARGNPTIKTLAAVLKATGLRISIAPAP